MLSSETFQWQFCFLWGCVCVCSSSLRMSLLSLNLSTGKKSQRWGMTKTQFTRFWTKPQEISVPSQAHLITRIVTYYGAMIFGATVSSGWFWPLRNWTQNWRCLASLLSRGRWTCISFSEGSEPTHSLCLKGSWDRIPARFLISELKVHMASHL